MPVRIIKRTPLRDRYSVPELVVMVAALAYERYDEPLMSDASFDLQARDLAAAGTSIPGFDPSTGQWVHRASCVELDDLTRWCIGDCRRWAEQKGAPHLQLYHTQICRRLGIGHWDAVERVGA